MRSFPWGTVGGVFSAVARVYGELDIESQLPTVAVWEC